MYAIISGGALVSLCDKPRYVKLNSSGVYVEADKADAIGISVNGTLYNLVGGTAIADAAEAVVRESGEAEYVFRNRAKIVENEESTSAAIVEVEDAMCSLDETYDGRLNAVEDALCELDRALNEN